MVWLQVMDQKRFQALIGQMEAGSMSEREKLTLVEVMAPFHFLNCHHVREGQHRIVEGL